MGDHRRQLGITKVGSKGTWAKRKGKADKQQFTDSLLAKQPKAVLIRTHCNTGPPNADNGVIEHTELVIASLGIHTSVR